MSGYLNHLEKDWTWRDYKSPNVSTVCADYIRRLDEHKRNIVKRKEKKILFSILNFYII